LVTYVCSVYAVVWFTVYCRLRVRLVTLPFSFAFVVACAFTGYVYSMVVPRLFGYVSLHIPVRFTCRLFGCVYVWFVIYPALLRLIYVCYSTFCAVGRSTVYVTGYRCVTPRLRFCRLVVHRLRLHALPLLVDATRVYIVSFAFVPARSFSFFRYFTLFGCGSRYYTVCLRCVWFVCLVVRFRCGLRSHVCRLRVTFRTSRLLRVAFAFTFIYVAFVHTHLVTLRYTFSLFVVTFGCSLPSLIRICYGCVRSDFSFAPRLRRLFLRLVAFGYVPFTGLRLDVRSFTVRAHGQRSLFTAFYSGLRSVGCLIVPVVVAVAPRRYAVTLRYVVCLFVCVYVAFPVAFVAPFYVDAYVWFPFVRYVWFHYVCLFTYVLTLLRLRLRLRFAAPVTFFVDAIYVRCYC